MKVCMLDPLFFPYQGGTEKVVYEVGKRLVKKGYEIDVLTSTLPTAKKNHEEIEGMQVHRTPAVYFEKMPAFLPPPFTLAPFLDAELIREHADAEIFHIHNRFWYFPGTLALIKAMQKKLMLTIHNSRPRGLSPEMDFWGGIYDDTLGRILFSACDRINCVSKSALNDTIPKEMHGKCAVTKNGVDTNAFKPGNAGDVREKLGIGDAPLVLSNGRLIEQKGFAFLLDAFAEVKKKEKGAQLLIIGKGPLKDELISHAKKNGISDSLHFATGIPEAELPSYYNAADVFVLPSVYEPGAVVLFEALACGKPIIATNAGGNPEIVSSDCGFIVPPRSSADLRDKMQLLLSDDSLRKKLAVASRKRAVENFDWDVVTRNWDASYKVTIGEA